MAASVNGARGEVSLRAGGEDLVIAATMQGLAAVSTRLDCKSLADLFERLTKVEVSAMMAGVELLAIKGNGAKAAANLKLSDGRACADAFSAALAHHFDGDEGNDGAVETAA